MNSTILEKKADQFRQQIGLNFSDSLNLQSILYKLNVLTVFRPLSGNFSGMAIKVGEGESAKRFMLVNSAHSIGKQNFTICHELYHLFIQENFSSQVCTTGLFEQQTNPEERYADIFASLFLLPGSIIVTLIPDAELSKNKIQLNTILKIEHYFGCSRAALLYRLKQLEIIDRNGYNSLSRDVIKGAIQYGYNTNLYTPNHEQKVIGDYGYMAKQLFDMEVISETHYYSYLLDLGFTPEQLENLEVEDEPSNNSY
jgi:Zn-dependent peptidase ImmA (M78 family)